MLNYTTIQRQVNKSKEQDNNLVVTSRVYTGGYKITVGFVLSQGPDYILLSEDDKTVGICYDDIIAIKTTN